MQSTKAESAWETRKSERIGKATDFADDLSAAYARSFLCPRCAGRERRGHRKTMPSFALCPDIAGFPTSEEKQLYFSALM